MATTKFCIVFLLVFVGPMRCGRAQPDAIDTQLGELGAGREAFDELDRWLEIYGRKVGPRDRQNLEIADKKLPKLAKFNEPLALGLALFRELFFHHQQHGCTNRTLELLDYVSRASQLAARDSGELRRVDHLLRLAGRRATATCGQLIRAQFNDLLEQQPELRARVARLGASMMAAKLTDNQGETPIGPDQWAQVIWLSMEADQQQQQGRVFLEQKSRFRSVRRQDNFEFALKFYLEDVCRQQEQSLGHLMHLTRLIGRLQCDDFVATRQLARCPFEASLQAANDLAVQQQVSSLCGHFLKSYQRQWVKIFDALIRLQMRNQDS